MGRIYGDIAQKFGFSLQYSNLSRWQYMEGLFGFCIENDKFSTLLAYLFSIENFQKHLKNCPASEIITQYNKIVECAIAEINKELFFGGNELVQIGNTYKINQMGSKIEIFAPEIKVINQDYIRDIAKRANDDINNENFDSATTKARTLLEELFCYVIEQKGQMPSEDGDIGKLYKQVKTLYNMYTNPNFDKRFNKLLSGLESIVQAIAEMRNKNSDAHGVGEKRVTIRDYHARLLVNSSIAMSDFILSVANYANENTKV